MTNAKTTPTDLFPETLLVTIRDGHVETDSLKVAARFGKRHKNVLRDIGILISEVEKLGGDRLKIEPISYLDSRNREQKMYRMDRLAFSVLVNRFTGAKSLAWQLDYHRKFEDMERQLLQLTTRFAHVVDIIRPNLRPVVEGTEQGLSRSAIAEPLGKSANSVTYHRRSARQLGLLH